MDYTLQKAVELGVSRIGPIATQRSVVRLSAERGERRTEHWARVVQAASEQSGRTRVPRLLPVATMDEWLSGVVPGPSCSSSAKRARAGSPIWPPILRSPF